MADKTQHEVEVEFTAKDLTSAVLGKIGKSAKNLSINIDKISSRVTGLVRNFGGIGAIFGFGASVNAAKKYLGHIERISTSTMMTRNAAAGVDEAMKSAGVSAADQSGTLAGIVRRQRALRDGSKETAKLAKLYGLNLKKGPQEVLVQISKQLEKGKMAAGDVVKLVGESGRGTLDLLRRGPAEVQRMIEEGQKRMSHVNALSIHHYKEFGSSLDRVKGAWTRIATIIGVKVLPHLTTLIDALADKIDSWAAGAAKFGEWLGNHLDSAITQAKVFSKIMLANYAVMKLSGGTGIMGMMGKAGKMAKGKSKLVDFGGAANAAIGWSAKKTVGKGGMRAKGLGGLANILSKFGSVGKVLTKFFFGAVNLGKIAKFLMKLTVVGLVIGAVVAGIKQILKNTDGIRTKISALLSTIWDNIKGIGASLAKVFGPNGILGSLMAGLGKGFMMAVKGVLWLMEKISWFIRVVVRMIEAAGRAQLLSFSEAAAGIKFSVAREKDRERITRRIQQNELDKTAKLLQGRKKLTAVEMRGLKGIIKQGRLKGASIPESLTKFLEAPSERATVYQDFRGSRFDITQAFAEGFDPDRIAVAFTNELSALGERRLQTGLAGTFTGTG